MTDGGKSPLDVIREANRKDLRGLEEIIVAMLAIGEILQKLGNQLRPLGLTAPYEKDLRELAVALTRLRRGK